MANSLVQDNVNFWMTKYSECALLLNNIKGLLAVYKAGEIHQTLCEMLENKPTASNPPPVPQLMLHIPVVNPSSKKAAKQTTSPMDIYRVVKHEYQRREPGVISDSVIPQVPGSLSDVTLENLEDKVRKCQEIVQEVDNMTLYNAANFGHWLELAFGVFQQEKEAVKLIWPSFKSWVENRCGISQQWAKELRNFYTLVSEYPQLLFCRLSLSFFRKNKKHLLSYFDCEPEIALRWKHPLVCKCQKCGPWWYMKQQFIWHANDMVICVDRHTSETAV